MKMTKIESARIIAESTDNPVCRSIFCSKCFNSRKGKTCKDGNLVAIEKAKAYIKRHESKTKKKDHILDTTKKVEEPVKKWVKCIDNEHGLLPLIIGKVYETIFIRHCFICVLDEEGNERAFNERRFEFVEEPKPIKTVGIDNSDVTLVLTAQHESTPLQIAKMIRDNGYDCSKIAVCNTCEFKCWNNAVLVRKQLIDNYISANEPQLVNVDSTIPKWFKQSECDEEPKPIKFALPKTAFVVSDEGISVRSKNFTIDENGYLLYNGHKCYDDVDKAVAIFKAREKA